jgi:hypothetical protein
MAFSFSLIWLSVGGCLYPVQVQRTAEAAAAEIEWDEPSDEEAEIV